jgi:hypothetical protein
MSQQKQPDNNAPAVKPDWRKRLQEVGKAEFIREEMERLGFWPPVEGVEAQALEAEAALAPLYPELSALRQELTALDRQIREAGDIPVLLEQIRKRRIERVRAARAAKREQHAAQQEQRRAQDREWRQRTLPYLGHGVSGGLKYQDADPARLEALGLPILNTAEELAAAIGIPVGRLAWLTYHRGASALDHYARFTLPKKSGGTRTISAPKRQLRTAQNWVLTELLARLAIHDAAMAFRPKRSILHNARAHAGKAVVVRLDLKEFFPSIRFRRVKGVFAGCGYNEGIATLLALLCTEAPRVAATLDGQTRYVAIGERQLPQGACTSPAITNLLCRRMDARLVGIARAYGFTYTRYADDLVFSHSDLAAPVGLLLGRIHAVIAAEGYTINAKKTRVMRPQHRQAVTGVVVNETPRISRRDLRRFRAFLHHCETEGLLTVSERIGKNAAAHAGGYLAFIHMINPDQAAKIRQAHPWLTPHLA